MGDRLALHTADQGSISLNIHVGPPHPPGVTPECRAWCKLSTVGMAKKQ